MRHRVDCHTMMMNPYESWIGCWVCSDNRKEVVERIGFQEYAERIRNGLLPNPLPPFFLGVPPLMSQVFLVPEVSGLTEAQKSEKAMALIRRNGNKDPESYRHFYMKAIEKVAGRQMEWIVHFYAGKMHHRWAALYRLHGDQLVINFTAFTLRDSLERHLGSLDRNCAIVYRDKISFVFLLYQNNQLSYHVNLNSTGSNDVCSKKKWKALIEKENKYSTNTLFLIDEPNIEFSFSLADLDWDGATVIVTQAGHTEPLTFQQAGLINPRCQWIM